MLMAKYIGCFNNSSDSDKHYLNFYNKADLDLQHHIDTHKNKCGCCDQRIEYNHVIRKPSQKYAILGYKCLGKIFPNLKSYSTPHNQIKHDVKCVKCGKNKDIQKFIDNQKQQYGRYCYECNETRLKDELRKQKEFDVKSKLPVFSQCNDCSNQFIINKYPVCVSCLTKYNICEHCDMIFLTKTSNLCDRCVQMHQDAETQKNKYLQDAQLPVTINNAKQMKIKHFFTKT